MDIFNDVAERTIQRKPEPTKKVTGISSKFNGPQNFKSTVTGEYWETLPEFSADADKLQKALLKDLADKKAKTEKLRKPNRREYAMHELPDFLAGRI